MPTCYIALGGNTGDVAAGFRQCLEELNSEAAVQVQQVSSFYGTPAVGELSGGEFLNAAARLKTILSPLELLDLLQQVELQHGRTHDVRWGPRTLDLDILLYDDRVYEDSRLTVPHPACWYRRFVLDPLAEIAAHVQHPVKGITVGELRKRLLRHPLAIAVCGGSKTGRAEVLAALNEECTDIIFTEWIGPPALARNDPAIIAWLGDGDDGMSWDQLPVVPRLDVTRLQGTPADALVAVAQSASGV